MHLPGPLDGGLEAGPCAVACPFCYLGARRPADTVPLGPTGPRLSRDAVAEALVRGAARLDYAELAIALSEPIADDTRALLARLLAAAGERPRAITTTTTLVLAEPTLLAGASRLNLSVDPWKLPGGDAALLDEVRRAARAAKARGVEVVAIASLSTPGFAETLVAGLLAQLVDSPELDAVALNALKPPPPFCDRAFWLSTLARLRPLLDRALDRRLFLDCYVGARLLGIGGCPARPDLSPGGRGIAFRSCVYAPTPDAEVRSVDELDERLAEFVAPAVCPFDTRL
jgi:hypothetical protein